MAATASGVDDEIRELYGSPLAGFVAARQALAKKLKAAGDERAAEVRELRKPSLSAWAVNALFATEPKPMAELIGAGAQARAEAARKSPDARALRDVLTQVRAATERLEARGIELMSEGEKAPGEAIVERLRANLDALAFDPAVASLASRRWLDEDLAAPGFELMAALQVAAAGAPAPRPAPARASAPKPGTSKAEARAQQRAREQAQAELRRAEAAAVEARRAVEETAAAASAAERERQAAERQAEQARFRARAAQVQLAEAEQAVQKARAALTRVEA